MSEENERLIRSQIRSPRSAAIAGIIFSLLVMTSMILISSIESPDDLNRDWLRTWFSTASLAIGLVPFAGITFLWFTGVIRDSLGSREDKLFSTVFFGSGIVYVVIIFIWAASFGAIYRIFAVEKGALVADYDIFIFGFAFMDEILGNYALRVAGVYMLSISSLWTRTGVMPRWLTVISYIVALGFLFFAGKVREAQFGFPGWVFVVSVYILILNYRRSREEALNDGPN
jgi:hypothetical protein